MANNKLVVTDKSELATLTPNEYFEIYNPKNALQKFKDVKTLSDAVNEQSDPLAKIKKQFGEEKVLSYIKLWLVFMNKLVEKGLNEYQIDYIAETILQDFYWLKIHQIVLVFKTGMRSNLYGGLSTEKVLKWFDDHAMEYQNLYVQMKSNHKHDELGTDMRTKESQQVNFKEAIKSMMLKPKQ